MEEAIGGPVQDKPRSQVLSKPLQLLGDLLEIALTILLVPAVIGLVTGPVLGLGYVIGHFLASPLALLLGVAAIGLAFALFLQMIDSNNDAVPYTIACALSAMLGGVIIVVALISRPGIMKAVGHTLSFFLR